LGARVGAAGRRAPVDLGVGGDADAALPVDGRFSNAAGPATR
jgi:hypothetical protein